MRVLVTGGAGFVGSHTVDLLLHEGHDVTVLDNFSTGSRDNLNPGALTLELDVRAPLDEAFRRLNPDVVVHLAAQVSVPNSITDPLTDSAVNVGGTINVMEAAARAGARKVVTMSSAAVYGNPVALPLTEESATLPLSPYGLSKLAAEQYGQLLGRTRGIAYTILRPANVYGPRQQADGEGAVVPGLLSRFLAGQDPVIHGDGSQTRDFLYVSDMAMAIRQALVLGDGEVLNISSGTSVSVKELWHLMAGLFGWIKPPQYGRPRPGDISHSWMANHRAKTALNWGPRVPLDEGLVRTLAASRMDQVAASEEV